MLKRVLPTLSVLLLAAMPLIAQAPAAIEKELLRYAEDLGKYGTYGGGYDEDKLNKTNELIRQKLLEYGKREDVLKYGFPKIKGGGELYVATSKDNRFRIYSWDMNDGGSMHDFDKVYQYQGKSGKVYSIGSKDGESDGGGSFYPEIFQVDAADGPIYLATGTFIGSTSLAGASISAFTIDAEKLNPDAKLIRTGSGLKNSVSFSYDFFSVVDRPERPVKLFFFDEKNRSFRFPVVIEDTKTPQGRVTDKFITYKFDGKYFVKVS